MPRLSLRRLAPIVTLGAAALAGGCGGPRAVAVSVLNLSAVNVDATAQTIGPDGAPSPSLTASVPAGEQYVFRFEDTRNETGVAVEIAPNPSDGVVPYAVQLGSPGPYRLRINGADAGGLTISRTTAAYDDRDRIPEDPRRQNRVDDIPPPNPSFNR